MTKIQLARAIYNECKKDNLFGDSYHLSELTLGLMHPDKAEYCGFSWGTDHERFTHLFPAEIADKKFNHLRAVFDYLDAVESFENYWARYNSLEEDKNEELKEHCRIFWMKSREL